jgi:hypothetical protein
MVLIAKLSLWFSERSAENPRRYHHKPGVPGRHSNAR